MIYGIFLVAHILIAALLVTVVLMQTGRGGGLAGAFGGGGGGGQTLFGGRGATTFLTKTTWVLGVAFMVTSFVMALAVSHRGSAVQQEEDSVRDRIREAATSTQPTAAPGTESPGSGLDPGAVPLGEETPGGGVEAPAAAPEGEAAPPAGQPPTESSEEAPSSGGN